MESGGAWACLLPGWPPGEAVVRASCWVFWVCSGSNRSSHAVALWTRHWEGQIAQGLLAHLPLGPRSPLCPRRELLRVGAQVPYTACSTSRWWKARVESPLGALCPACPLLLPAPQPQGPVTRNTLTSCPTALVSHRQVGGQDRCSGALGQRSPPCCGGLEWLACGRPPSA